jgi:predicted Zn-dependent protease
MSRPDSSAPTGRVLAFEVSGGEVYPIVVPVYGQESLEAMDKAVAMFKDMVRAAWKAGGCRSFLVGVHVRGAACDHEVKS